MREQSYLLNKMREESYLIDKWEVWNVIIREDYVEVCLYLDSNGFNHYVPCNYKGKPVQVLSNRLRV